MQNKQKQSSDLRGSESILKPLKSEDTKYFTKALQRKKKDAIFFLYKINNLIIERKLLQTNQKILIAVSGGQDSICLLTILFHLKKKWNWKLAIIHCDHRWNPHSKFQAKHVAYLASNLEISYYEGITIESVQKESSARHWRYTLMQSIAVSNNYTAILTGHNACDRIETLLYNLTRGSGLHGLQSIKWKRSLLFSHFLQSVVSHTKFSFLLKKVKYIKKFDKVCCTVCKKKRKVDLIRPLLEITRTEIRNLSNIWNLPSWPDRSNEEVRIKRNRIRHRLLPYMRIHYNPNIDQTLVRWAEIVQFETLYLDQLTHYILSKIEIQKKISYISTNISLLNSKYQNQPYKNFTKSRSFFQSAIPIDLLRSLPLALQRRILKKYIYRNTKRILRFQYIEQIRLSCLFHTYLTQTRPISFKHPVILEEQAKKEKNIERQFVTPFIFFSDRIKCLIHKNYLFIFCSRPLQVTLKNTGSNKKNYLDLMSTFSLYSRARKPLNQFKSTS